MPGFPGLSLAFQRSRRKDAAQERGKNRHGKAQRSGANLVQWFTVRSALPNLWTKCRRPSRKGSKWGVWAHIWLR
jgi:hypothetical protein